MQVIRRINVVDDVGDARHLLRNLTGGQHHDLLFDHLGQGDFLFALAVALGGYGDFLILRRRFGGQSRFNSSSNFRLGLWRYGSEPATRAAARAKGVSLGKASCVSQISDERETANNLTVRLLSKYSVASSLQRHVFSSPLRKATLSPL